MPQHKHKWRAYASEDMGMDERYGQGWWEDERCEECGDLRTVEYRISASSKTGRPRKTISKEY